MGKLKSPYLNHLLLFIIVFIYLLIFTYGVDYEIVNKSIVVGEIDTNEIIYWKILRKVLLLLAGFFSIKGMLSIMKYFSVFLKSINFFIICLFLLDIFILLTVFISLSYGW